MTSHCDDSPFGRHSCPRAALAENHGHRLARQGAEEVFGYRAGFDGLLVRMRLADEACELRGSEIGYGEEMTRCEWRGWWCRGRGVSSQLFSS